MVQVKMFTPLLQAVDGSGSHPSESLTTTTPHVARDRVYRPPIRNPEHIMVVDDNPEDCATICQFLRQALGIYVDGSANHDQAVERFKEVKDYDLVVVDFRLKDVRGKIERGARVAKALLDLRPDLNVVFTSSAPPDDVQDTVVYGKGFPFAIKTPNAILERIYNLCEGYWEDVADSEEIAYTGSGSFLQQLGMMSFAHQPLSELLQPMLYRLRLDTQTSQAVVFEADSTSKSVSVISADPMLPSNVQKVILDGLYYSPIQNVVEDEQAVYEPKIIQPRYPRFKSLYPVLPFRSFFGLPSALSRISGRKHATPFCLMKQEKNLIRLTLRRSD